MGRDPEGALGIVTGGARPSPERAQPHVVPWQHGCGTMCGEVGLGCCWDRALRESTKQLPGSDSKDLPPQKKCRLNAFLVEVCFSRGRAHL